ncbi:MAG: RAMP superfamily CRISPR-associated protein [Candidatus Baltobacteraceae bacterium]
MHILRATYRIVTPMYIAGADQAAPEFRVPSFKGALRFWWRALEWPKIISKEPDENRAIACLAEREAQLFGTADSAIGRSKIAIRCCGVNAKVETKVKRPYGGYGLDGRSFLSAGDFELELRAATREPLEKIIPALKVLGLCGGLGSRSRNGYGSLTLRELRWVDSGENEWKNPSSADELQREISKLLKSDGADIPPFTAASKNVSVAVGNKPPEKCEKIHHDLLSAYRKFLYSNEENPRQSPYELEERKQFGEPRKSKVRRAKPLFMHVHEISQNHAIPVAVYMPGSWTEAVKEIPGEGKLVREFLQRVEKL